jgi:hypothetical protein
LLQLTKELLIVRAPRALLWNPLQLSWGVSWTNGLSSTAATPFEPNSYIQRLPRKQPTKDDALNRMEDSIMMRERALQVLLALAGAACLLGLYPLTGAVRDGPATTINRQDQMILGIYIVLGVFLLLAARNPRQHRSLILFAGWSTLAHDSVMILQGVQYHDLRGDLMAYATIAAVGLALVGLTLAIPPHLSLSAASASRVQSTLTPANER